MVTGAGVEGHDLRHMSEVARKGRFDVTIDNVTDDLNVLREVNGFSCFQLLQMSGPGGRFNSIILSPKNGPKTPRGYYK